MERAMPIDFKNHYTGELKKLIIDITDLIVSRQHGVIEELRPLTMAFSRYYMHRDRDLELDQAIFRAREVLSEFLQYLVVHSVNSIYGKETPSRVCDYVSDLLSQLLNLKVFHYRSSYVPTEPKAIIWTDPKFNSTTLMALCRFGNVELIYLHMKMMSAICRGDELTNYIAMKNINGYSALTFLCEKDAYLSTLEYMLTVAADCNGGVTCEGFKKLMVSVDKLGRTLLNISTENNCEKIKILLQSKAREAFGSVTPRQVESSVNDNSVLSAATQTVFHRGRTKRDEDTAEANNKKAKTSSDSMSPVTQLRALTT
jgi:hypothetical protein